MKKYKLLSLFLALFLMLPLATPVGADLIDEMEVAATAAILVEGDTGEVLFEQQAREKRYPASLTKVMTALLVLEALERGELSMDQVVEASESALKGLSKEGSNQEIRVGERMTVENLLYCTLLASANDACNVLAEAVAGSVEAFVERMNLRARELGMMNTHFANAHGFHDDEHYTTAYDLALLTAAAMKNATFRIIVGTVDYYVPETNLHKQRHFYTTNGLLSNWHYIGYTYKYAVGVKTGSTNEAGLCLISAAVKNGRTLYAVVMGTQNVTDKNGRVTDRPVFSESKRLLEWGFENFTRKTLLTTTDLQGQIPVTLSKTEQVVIAPAGELEAMVPKDVTAEDLTVIPVISVSSVEAPVEKGQVLGQVTVSYRDKVYGTMDLVAISEVERDEWAYRMDRLNKVLDSIWVKIILVILVVALVALVILRLFVGRRNQRRRTYRARRYRGRR